MQQFFLLLVVLAILAAITFFLYLFLPSRINKPNAFLIASGIVSLVVFGTIYIVNSENGNTGTKFDVEPNYLQTIVEIRFYDNHSQSGQSNALVATLTKAGDLLQFDRFLESNLADWNYSLGGYFENLYHLELTYQNGETKIINIRKSNKPGEVILAIPGYQKNFKTAQLNELLQSLRLGLL